MDEGVDAGRRGHRARQTDGQFRVGNDDARHHLRMEDDFFLVRLFVEDDAGPADFRAGARRGRHRDDRRDAGGIRPGPPVADVLEIPQRAGLPRHEGHHLAGVERRSAAEGHDAIVTSRAIGTQARLDVAQGRVAPDGAEQRRILEGGEGVLDHRRAGQPFVGDDQRPLDAGLRAGLGQFADPAGAGPDGGGIIPIAAQHVMLMSSP